MKDFKELLALVPNKPGSYQMKNKDGIIIYVGKAKNLRNRLKSYFMSTHTGKTFALVKDIDSFEYIVTKNELESLILEITLIKKYNPKYNILLKDDKTYPFIELTNEDYPTLKVVRNVKRSKKNKYLYGPYPNVTAARKTVNIINRIYPLRKCHKLKKELCLYYHINECLGYCIKNIDKTVIDNMKKEIIKFLNGDSSIVIKKIETEIEVASNSLNYERAIELKNMLDDINITLKKQEIDLNQNYNFDLINYYKDKNYLCIVIFFIRNGLLFGRSIDIITSIDDAVNDVILYIIKFYEKNKLIVKDLYVPNEELKTLLEDYLQVNVIVPKKGKLKKVMDMAFINVKDKLLVEEEILKKNDQVRIDAVKELQVLLNIKSASRIESFDNSHLFGTYYVGGMVVYEDFLPLKDNYRKYKIATSVKDDLAAMKEVLYRRYYKVLMENLQKPDLIVLDGGKTQIKVAKEVLNDLKLNIPIVCLVKDDKHKTSYVMNSNYELLNLNSKSNLFLFLTRIQEEVHRYAISYHRNIKSKGMLASVLDMAPGIGEVRRRELLKKFGSLKKIKEASVQDLEEVVGNTVAFKLYNYLKEIEKENL